MIEIEDEIIALLQRKPKSSRHKVARILAQKHSEEDVFGAIESLLNKQRVYLYNGKSLCVVKDRKRNNLNDRRIREYHTDEHHKILRRTRAAVIRKLNRGKPINSTELKKILGCSTKEFGKHLESLWKEGMNWENWGVGRDKWHIDHIVPAAYFDLTDPSQLKKCFHYTNQQPMWSTDNTTKGAMTRKTDSEEKKEAIAGAMDATEAKSITDKKP